MDKAGPLRSVSDSESESSLGGGKCPKHTVVTWCVVTNRLFQKCLQVEVNPG